MLLLGTGCKLGVCLVACTDAMSEGASQACVTLSCYQLVCVIVQALHRLGGWQAAARRLSMTTQRRKNTRTLAQLIQELKQFMAQQQTQLSSGSSGVNSAPKTSSLQAVKAPSHVPHEGSVSTTTSEAVRSATVPTQQQLVSAGRRDLVYDLHIHGYEAVAKAMGLMPTTRGRTKVRVAGSMLPAISLGCYIT